MNKISEKSKKDSASEVDTKVEKGGFFKRMWDRYLKRLNKVTKGKPQCCK